MTGTGDAGSARISQPADKDPGRRAYRESGVDVEAGARAVELIRGLAGGPSGAEVVEGVGGFAGLVRLDDRRLLAAATDGVGTKTEIARMLGRLDTVGIDLVAMCANDVVCTGAAPLFFLDYLAVGRVVPEEVAAIVAGVAEGCRRAGCALVGGETAEHPGVMEEGRFDLAGFCVGLVERDRVIGPSRVEPGDVLIGFPSSGLHANGFSLVRRALAPDAEALHRFEPALGRTVGEALLEPTTIYVDAVLALAAAELARSAAHITGGGILENLPRAIRPGLGAVVDTDVWTPAPIFGVVAAAAGLRAEEMYGVFNMGLGMIVAVPPRQVGRAIDLAAHGGTEAVAVGTVVDEPGIRLQ